MHGSMSVWLANALAAAMILGGAATGRAQHTQPAPIADYELRLPTGDQGNGPTTQLVSASVNYGADDVNARIQRLEDALLKSEAKAREEKKKAESVPSVKVGGLVFVDSAWFGQNAQSRSALGDAADTTHFRTARLTLSGEGFNVMYYNVEVDFSQRSDYTTGTTSSHTHTLLGIEQVGFKDVFVGVKELPLLGRVQAGHFKEPFGLEELTSDRFQTFTERSLTSAFTPSRNIGVMAMDNYLGENGTWAMGAFRMMGDTPPYLADDRGFYTATSRLTWLPWHDDATEGRGLVHLGVAGSYRDFSNTSVRVSQRPEVGAGPVVVDTRYPIVGDRLTNVVDEKLAGFELAAVYGPLSVQSEYMTASFERSGAANAHFNSGYIFVSYFLTGEHRPYRRSTATFDRVRPYENFFRVRGEDGCNYTGWGAWELAYRYSWVDLDANNAAILGGQAFDHTFGVNWYLTPYLKLMGDYVHSTDLTQNNGPHTFIDSFVARAAFDF